MIQDQIGQADTDHDRDVALGKNRGGMKDPHLDESAIMVYINCLRQKTEDHPSKRKYIQTVRGLGYRFMV